VAAAFTVMDLARSGFGALAPAADGAEGVEALVSTVCFAVPLGLGGGAATLLGAALVGAGAGLAGAADTLAAGAALAAGFAAALVLITAAEVPRSALGGSGFGAALGGR
jgi:hypothetical protein